MAIINVNPLILISTTLLTFIFITFAYLSHFSINQCLYLFFLIYHINPLFLWPKNVWLFKLLILNSLNGIEKMILKWHQEPRLIIVWHSPMLRSQGCIPLTLFLSLDLLLKDGGIYHKQWYVIPFVRLFATKFYTYVSFCSIYNISANWTAGVYPWRL